MDPHDEYIDYSCSTSIERLARDVETSLRGWHLQESDRHASVRDSESVSSRKQAGRGDAIRSASIPWTVSYYKQNNGTRISAEVDLELNLWDGPRSEQRKASDKLPLSLQRRSIALPNNLFDDFSSLFGIGQHITLTPCQPDLSKDGADLLLDVVASLWQRHHDDLCVPVLIDVLSTWLQTALNIAVTNCHTSVPVFGVWGYYRKLPPLVKPYSHTVPLWMQAKVNLEETSKRRRQRHQRGRPKNDSHTSPCITGHLIDSQISATFAIQAVPAGHLARKARDPRRNARWTTWGRLLQQQTGEEEINLCAARQVYIWTKPPVQSKASLLLEGGAAPKYDDLYHNWRQTPKVTDTYSETVEDYRRECRVVTLSILEKSWKGRQASGDDPLWGPPLDPVAAVRATASFSSKPLLSLPLNARSRNISDADQAEAEETMESAVLDPYNSAAFTIATSFDHDIPQTSLAATQRCVLAALIRTATLPSETLLTHLVNESLMEGWDSAAGNIVAGSLARKAHVGNLTMALVAAMDWGNAIEDMIEISEAEDIVGEIMDGLLALQYPSPPDAVFSDPPPAADKAFAPLLKSAAPGRIVSILCLHLARVRSPSNMAMIWTTFVATLRSKWETRESLPNMAYIPGIDPSEDTIASKKCFSSIGVEATLAAYINSSEPEPDEINCLLGQKLQVFGVCLETVIASEMREVEEMENRYAAETDADMETDTIASEEYEIPIRSGSSPPIPPKVGGAPVVSFADPPAREESGGRNSLSSTRTLFHGSIVDGLPQIDGMRRRGGDDLSTVLTAQFFDAEEGDTIAYAPPEPEMTLGRLLLENADHSNLSKRRGARCPIQGVNLVDTGDQLYAPYLQRPFPLTDDAIAQRKAMLSRQKSSAKASSTVSRRLEVAHLLQKPKLLSDMRAFKAANPGAIFQDFINWYGNPTDPLEEYDKTHRTSVTGANDSVSIKLDKAAEGIRVLSMTRDFWSSTWEEATPIPASVQDPLFDANMTAEMALDFLETLHPASLLCQVMAVNLSAAFFTLNASAGRARKIVSVSATLDYLRSKVEAACQSLADDVVSSAGSTEPDNDPKEVPSSVASIKSLMACEMACVALQESEIVVSRAISLLHKFPDDQQLVDTIMKNPEGAAVLCSSEGRQDIFGAILKQQERAARAKLVLPPSPSMREYIFRNTNAAKPCQLSVRYCENSNEDDELVIAFSKCKR